MKKLILLAMLGSLLTGCGTDVVYLEEPVSVPSPSPSPVIVVVVSPSPSPIVVLSPSPAPSVDPFADNKIMVDQYNQYREAIGQDDIMPGLGCTLYTVPTSTTKIVGATLTGVGSFTLLGGFNVPDQSTSNKFDILPTSLQSIYQTWYVVKCTGYIAIGQSGWYEFDTSSDDGSNLYIDGGLLVNNDGLHSTQNVMAAKFLQANIHSFELDYLQGSGNESLIVNMNGNLLPAEVLYH